MPYTSDIGGFFGDNSGNQISQIPALGPDGSITTVPNPNSGAPNSSANQSIAEQQIISNALVKIGNVVTRYVGNNAFSRLLNNAAQAIKPDNQSSSLFDPLVNLFTGQRFSAKQATSLSWSNPLIWLAVAIAVYLVARPSRK